jgi:hypothetical protein
MYKIKTIKKNYHSIKLKDVKLLFSSDKYINATKFFRLSGKSFSNWIKTNEGKKCIRTVSNNTNINKNDLINNIGINDTISGYYVHHMLLTMSLQHVQLKHWFEYNEAILHIHSYCISIQNIIIKNPISILDKRPYMKASYKHNKNVLVIIKNNVKSHSYSVKRLAKSSYNNIMKLHADTYPKAQIIFQLETDTNPKELWSRMKASERLKINHIGNCTFKIQKGYTEKELANDVIDLTKYYDNIKI